MAKITVTIKGKPLKEVMLRKDETLTIGRDPSNGISLDNPAVSRFHAKIYKHEWPFYVEDLKSTNGTVLNGSKLDWKAALSNNDKITIGKHTLIFNDDPSDYGDTSKKIGPDATIFIKK
jgi:pSer/pThr/pTyr-binding forkhead associated (FHA) protein